MGRAESTKIYSIISLSVSDNSGKHTHTHRSESGGQFVWWSVTVPTKRMAPLAILPAVTASRFIPLTLYTQQQQTVCVCVSVV